MVVGIMDLTKATMAKMVRLEEICASVNGWWTSGPQF